MSTEFSPKRYGLITGSKCAVLHPKKSAEVGQRTYARRLASQMYFKFYDNTSTWQTEHGKDFEETAFDFYKLNYDKTAIHKPEFKCLDNFGGSADCLCEDYGVDFKCPTSLEKWEDYMYDGIDDQQYHQAQMYIWLYNKKSWKVCAFLTETHKMIENGITYPVPHNKRMIVIDVFPQDGWVEKTYKNAIPVIQQRDQYYNALVEKFILPTDL
jgi:hypothetical protein